MQLRSKELRMQKKMTQSQLANAIGSTQQSVTDWETGKKVPHSDALIAMADTFGVSIDYLVGATDCPYRVLSSQIVDGEILCFTTKKDPQPVKAEGVTVNSVSASIPVNALPQSRQELERLVEVLVQKALSEQSGS